MDLYVSRMIIETGVLAVSVSKLDIQQTNYGTVKLILKFYGKLPYKGSDDNFRVPTLSEKLGWVYL